VSYTRGTDTGRIRELVGDLESLYFTDPQITDALSQEGSVVRASIYLLIRIHNDSDLIIRKYSAGGRLDNDTILRIQAQIVKSIELLERGLGTSADLTPGCTPESNLTTRVSQFTDSDGLRKQTDIDSALENMENR